METSIKIEYWALHSHILSHFQNGGTFNEAIAKWYDKIKVVKYFWYYYNTQKF